MQNTISTGIQGATGTLHRCPAIALQKTGSSNDGATPPEHTGDSYRVAAQEEPLLMPPPGTNGILPSSRFTEVETGEGCAKMAEFSAKVTMAAAGAVSTSPAASCALQQLPVESRGIRGETEMRARGELLWLEKLKEIEGLADGLGMGLDEKIKETVAALQVNGFHTRQSCEGHVNWGCGTPWVDLTAPGQPAPLFGQKGNSIYILNQFNGQEEIYRQVAAHHGITVEELMDRENYGKNQELLREAFLLSHKNGKTAEYEEWCDRGRALLVKMDEVLAPYYEAMHVPEADKIKYFKFGDGAFRIYTGPEDDQNRTFNTRTDEEKKALALRLPGSQRAMNEFALYLKEHFLAHGPLVTDP